MSASDLIQVVVRDLNVLKIANKNTVLIKLDWESL